MISRKKFKPENITVTEINDEYSGFIVNYKDVFNLFIGESMLMDLTWHNPLYKIELVERLVEKSLAYIQANPNPHKTKES
jgi:hypothetical protein